VGTNNQLLVSLLHNLLALAHTLLNTVNDTADTGLAIIIVAQRQLNLELSDASRALALDGLGNRLAHATESATTSLADQTTHARTAIAGTATTQRHLQLANDTA